MNLPGTRLLLALISGVLATTAASPVNAEYVEGFSRTIEASNEGVYADNRGTHVESSWEYAQDGDQSVTWETAPVPQLPSSEEVTFVWSVGLSRQEGPHELFLNDELCLTFTTGWTSESRTWAEGEYRLEFLPMLTDQTGEVHGLMRLTVSAGRLEADVPAQLRVRGVEGGGGTWFMLHHYVDSHAHAETGIVALPSGRRLLIGPPGDVFTVPNRVAWTCPVLLGKPAREGKVDVFSVIAHLPGTEGVEKIRLDLTLQPDEEQIDLTLWEVAELPEARHELELVVVIEAGEELPAARWPVSVFHLNEYGALRNRINAKLDRLSSVHLDPPLQETALPSLAYSLVSADATIASWQSAAEVEQGISTVIDALTQTEARLEQVEVGQDPFAGVSGYLTQAYRSELDGRLQPYGVYVPTDFDGRLTYPLVVMLHGFTGTPGGAMQRVFGKGKEMPYQDNGYIVVTPYNRDNIGYTTQTGEDDVWRVVEQVQKAYSIDEDRVYLTGLSMGGGGTLHIGLHYADRFAAIAAVCGWSDWRVWAGEQKLAKVRSQVLDSVSILGYAENGLHLPVKLFHGDSDAAVNVEHSRRMAARLDELGYDVEYEEYPGVGHNSWDNAYEGGRVFAWFDLHRRNRFPKRVVHVTTDPVRYGKSYWTQVEALSEPYVFARLEASVEGNAVTVRTSNVSRFSLDLTPPLVTADQPVRVEVDGKICYEGKLPDGGRLSIAAANGNFEVAGVHKPGLVPVGGLAAATESWRVYVYGTAGTEAQNEAARRTAEQMAHVRGPVDILYTVVADTAFTTSQIEGANLILVGTPDTNTILGQMSDQLPIRWTAGGVAIGDQIFEADNQLLMLTCPNPLQPSRLLQVVASSSPEGFASYSKTGFGAPDYLLMQPDGTVIAQGLFTADWSVRPRSGGQ